MAKTKTVVLMVKVTDENGVRMFPESCEFPNKTYKNPTKFITECKRMYAKHCGTTKFEITNVVIG